MNQAVPTSKTKWLAFIALAAITFLAYLPALHGGFVWDDDSWTLGLTRCFQSVHGLWVMWVHTTVLRQYYPLTATSFWVDYQFWKFWTLPYHVENVLLHLLSVLLLWRLLRRFQVPGAWLAVALFALHPVMVQSVAWITERKNVLSLVLYLSAFLAYLRYEQPITRESEGPAPDASRFTLHASRFTPNPSRFTFHVSRFYCLALLLFVGALLAKTTAFSLPAVILLLAWWRRGRLEWRLDVLPTLPFFALSVGMCVVTAWVEKTHVGAHGPEFDLSLAQRCLVAGRVFWFYLGKLFWPAHLCFVYPRWQPDPAVWWQWLYPAAAAGLLLGLWLARNRIGRGPVTAAFFYVGTLLPLLGFVSAYAMRYSFVWNHWVYLPSLGPLVLVAAGLELARQRASLLHLPSSILHPPSSILCLLPLVLGVLTWHEAGQYADIETLWRTTLARNPDCWMAHGNLGMALAAQGKLTDAMEQYDAALKLNPNYVEAHVNRGNLLTRQGKLAEAIAEYDRALEIKPTYVDAHYSLGNALVQQGKPAEAIQQYNRALELDPNNTQVEVNLGNTLAQQGRLAEAIQHFQRAIQLDPNQPGVHLNLGNALAASGNLPEAIQNFEAELQINPDFAQAHLSLGTALAASGNLGDALQHFQRALAINPNLAEAHYYSGLALASQGKADEAAQQLQQAVDLATTQGNAPLAQAARQRLQALPP